MKTKQLIELLTKEDPTGYCDVLIGNMDILPIIYSEVGYWDGRMRLAEYDEGNTHPDRIRVTSSGSKINLIAIDPEQTFVDEILYYQKEFDYDVAGGSKVYPFNHEHYSALNAKMRWTYVAEAYSSWFFEYEKRKDKKQATLDLINDLRKKYGEEAKNSTLHTIETQLKGNAKTSAIDLINKIYENCPVAILSALSFSSDAVHIEPNSVRMYKFTVSLPTLGFGGGEIKFMKSGKKDEEGVNKYGYIELPYNDESHQIFGENIVGYYKKSAND